MQNLQLPVLKVSIGTGSDSVSHFLKIELERQPTHQEIQSICTIMHEHFYEQDGPFMYREFVKNEVHFWPTPKSKELFKTTGSAYAEYSAILKVLSLSIWIDTIALDADSCLSRDKRSSSLPEISGQELLELAQANRVCLLT